MSSNVRFHPIILAGGSGTRFWPRSRRSRAKQVLVLDGELSMIQQTAARLAPLAPAEALWVITNDLLSASICEQLKSIHRDQVICEPAARNTAPAAGLAAFLLERTDPRGVLGIFPADQVVSDIESFRSTLLKGISLAARGDNIVVLGIKPTRAETGYGYIESGDYLEDGVLCVRRFTEKPSTERAEEFISTGRYFWNSGMFLWSARTLADAIREHLSETAPLLEEIAGAYGTSSFERTFQDLYPKCENISIDYAVLEPRSAKGEHSSNLYCLPADFGWNDLGSWAALYQHLLPQLGTAESNVTETSGALEIEARGNYVYSPRKFVTLLGVEDLVVVETDDAILVTTRARAQDVAKAVKMLSQDHPTLI